jgi:membrane protease YdiL (CAAX protease family)
MPRTSVRRGPAPLALAVYGGITAITLAIAIMRDRSPIRTEPWIPLDELAGHALALVLGAALATVTVRATRAFVRRWSWARALHADLRWSVRDAGDVTLVVLGVASAVAEELLFRGLLATTVGLVLSSLAFGALHQLRGRVGWVWAGWATVMGFLFGGLFLATGSLLGPILSHAAINVANLRFLRDTEIEPPKKRLGGLLGRAS